MAKGAYIGAENHAKRNLPSGYTQVEYIESSGTQYINTGFNPNQNTRVVLDIYIDENSTPAKAVFGGRDGDTSAVNSFVVWAMTSSTFRSDFGNAHVSIDTATFGRLLIDKNKNVITINGNTITNAAVNFQSSYPLCLLTEFDVGGADERMTIGKIYSCQIYDNGSLIRDYVPCTNASGAAGLYDMVNAVFYTNAGSGTFAVGYSVSESSVARKIKRGYIGVDGIARKIKKAYIGIGGGVIYREVEYIESSGTQYIDTEFKPNQDTRVVVDISVVGQVSDFCAVLGSRNGASSAAFCLWLNTGIIYPQYGNVAYNNKSINLVTEGRLLIDMNSNIATVNDVSVTSTKTDFSSTYSMCLLALNSAGTVDSRKVNGKLRSCQIYDNGTLVHDYAPVINPNGTPGLFDKVTKQFYANKGTGNFTAGAETGATHVSSGIARPCWGGGELSYYGVVTALSAARHDFAAASNGEYAVFAGGIGKDSYGNDQIVGTVDGYSKNLTRTTSSTPLAIAFGLAGTNVGRYALFAGGANTSQCLNSVTSYDDSLTRKDVVSLNGSRHSLAATTVGSYALFGGGNYSRNSMSTSNQIDAFTDTLTKASLTPQGLAIARFGLSATTIGDYALFGPGAQNGSNDSTGIDVYDSNLTRTSTISITDTKKFYGAASNGVYALFGGGTTGGYVDKYSSVDAIDINLTKTSITPLSIARQYVSAANLGEYIIFAGGGTNGAVVGTTAVDVYDKQLVRTVGTDLSSARNRMAATSIGDFILFAGGYYAGAKLDIVDAFALI